MRAYALIATIVFIVFTACGGQASAQAIMCPNTVRLDVSPAVSGWTSNAAREGRFAGARVGDGQLVCSYDDNAATFTLTRPAPTGRTCRVIAGGFQCETRRQSTIIAPPTIARLPTTAPALPTCDLVVSSITITKLTAPGAVRVAYEITNRGNRVWTAGPGATATLVVENLHGFSSRNTQRLAERVEPGAVVATYSVDLSDDPFDVLPNATDWSGGTVDVTISAPGATFAGCSDLASANDAFRVSLGDTLGFMNSSQRMRTWSQ